MKTKFVVLGIAIVIIAVSAFFIYISYIMNPPLQHHDEVKAPIPPDKFNIQGIKWEWNDHIYDINDEINFTVSRYAESCGDVFEARIMTPDWSEVLWQESLKSRCEIDVDYDELTSNGAYSVLVTADFPSKKPITIGKEGTYLLRVESLDRPQRALEGYLLVKNKNVYTEHERLIPAKPLQLSHERLAGLLVSTTDDRILEKRIDDEKKTVFTTEKGNLIIRKGDSLSYQRLIDYSLHGKNSAIPREGAQYFVDKFMEKMDYVRDGSEWVEETDFGDRTEIVIQQRKDGWIIQNQIMRFNFRDDYTSIDIDKWYNDLNSLQIRHSQDDAKQIAYEYANSDEISKNPELQECKLQTAFPDWAEMEIVQDRLVYALPAGGCQVEAWEGHYPWIQVLVDATNGEILGWRYGILE